jgi:hypothetical protein
MQPRPVEVLHYQQPVRQQMDASRPCCSATLVVQRRQGFPPFGSAPAGDELLEAHANVSRWRSDSPAGI